jgi:DNA modification methylase
MISHTIGQQTIIQGDCLPVLHDLAGAGTTLVATQRLGLTAVGIEMGSSYVDVIRHRLIQEVSHAGQQADAA